jgi:outer membrane protein assembly factor BamB
MRLINFGEIKTTKGIIALVFVGLTIVCLLSRANGQTTNTQMPTSPLSFGDLLVKFAGDGTFTVDWSGRPALNGTWKVERDEIEVVNAPKSMPCALASAGQTVSNTGGGPGRYRFRVEGGTVRFDLISDECKMRRMMLDGTVWSPPGTPKVVAERRIVLTAAAHPRSLPRATNERGNWPSFRGPQAAGVAEKQNLPDRWDVKTGENIIWRTPIPGLAHSSPIVWGNTIFVTSAISSKANATFRPGLYGDGDASEDRSLHRWMIFAVDKRNGKIRWQRVAAEREPIDKRHIKSTYASSTPVTDGRIVVAWFGSQGLHAYDVKGNFLWRVDLGRVNAGAYDIPSVEWGPASSPIIWNGLVILQCDTQADSFIMALKGETGETVWKTEREELPSWGTPTVVTTAAGPELVTNASNFIRGYDPRTGKELWRLGRSSKITAPTPIFSDGLFVVASGRGPERPIYVVRAGSRGDLTLPEGQTTSEAIVWSRTGRGSYMPTPLIYNGVLYVLANNGVFDAYDLRTGEEIFRERLQQIGSGFSASPVAADGKIYLSNEDGEILVVLAGKKFTQVATNSMGELLMATPALSEGVMFVRTSGGLIAIGRKR